MLAVQSINVGFNIMLFVEGCSSKRGYSCLICNKWIWKNIRDFSGLALCCSCSEIDIFY